MSLKRFLLINLSEAEDQRFHLFEPKGRINLSEAEDQRFHLFEPKGRVLKSSFAEP
jgi:hypothetical protein